MQSNDKKKICIVVSSLGKGGAEKSSALLSKMLFGLGHEIHIVTVLPTIDYEYAGSLLNLGELKKLDDSFAGRIKRYFVFKKYLSSHNFDLLIDNRSRNSLLREIIISRLLYSSYKTVYCVRSYNLDTSFVHPKFVSKYIYRDAFKIIPVSEKISIKIRSLYSFKNVLTIHNAVEIEENSDLFNKNSRPYILFYGRLNDKIKNISLLLKGYSISKLPYLEIRLKIMGQGEDQSLIMEKIKALKLSTIDILDFNATPEKIIKGAKFTVLTSRYEGFPRVLIESLALGTPVISVDCKSGPSEIVIDKFNGLLIENHNPLVLADAMNRLVEDEGLYLRCKTNAKASVEKFSMTSISKQWQTLIDELHDRE